MNAFSELKKRIEGDVLFDEMSRALYSSGACLYRVRPGCIVRPKGTTDVVRTIRYAAERGISVTARGGGTSRTGNELGEGIILDFTRYMNRVLTFNQEKKWVSIQPGIILSALNRFLNSYNLFFPIDPSTSEQCTLGGMIANNSSGPHAVKYGTTRGYVLSLQVVLSNGEVISTDPYRVDGKCTGPGDGSGMLEQAIYRSLPGIYERYRKVLDEERPFTTKDSSGYYLWHLKDRDMLNITPLLVGSEGTLGVVTRAKLKLESIPKKALSGLVYFDRLSHVGEATLKILDLCPSMVEIMERRILDLAREHEKPMRPFLPKGIEALLFIEFTGDDEAELHKRFREVEQRIIREKRLAFDLKIAKNREEMAMFAKVRSVSGPILNSLKGPEKPLAFIEDAAVHPSRLPQYIAGLRRLFETYRLDAGIYGHAGDGNLHTMVFMDLSRPEHLRNMTALAEDVYDLTLRLKGTISAEHGDGRTRTHYLKKQYPKLYPAFGEIKRLFDPDNIFNPGIIVGSGDNPLDQHLKFDADYRNVPTGTILDRSAVLDEVENCSGCGKCRAYCPVARNVKEEWSMGRGKISLLREIFSGRLHASILTTPLFKKVMDFCINCKRCTSECPSKVDIPWVSIMGRSAFIEKHGEPVGSRLLTDTRLICETGSALSPLSNYANRLPAVRRVMEMTLGLDHRRRLPFFSNQTLRKLLDGRKQPYKGKTVVLFLCCSSNFNDPKGQGISTIDVLMRNNIYPLLPEFHCCQMARLNSGVINPIREKVQSNMEIMASHVDQGLDIIFTEPSCATAVKVEYPKILNTKTSHRVAERCFDIHEYLIRLYQKGELDLHMGGLDVAVYYHNPCHLKSLDVGSGIVKLLELIPGCRVRQYDETCCGIGGIFGMKKENFNLSMEIGSTLFQGIKNSKTNTVVTSCTACSMQIFQGTGKRTVYPVSMLAAAYRKEKG